MAIAWFICPYRTGPGNLGPNSMRYCAMDDFSPQILADGGAWVEAEGLGNFAIVKVRASNALIATISGQPEFLYLLDSTPLDTIMSGLTAQQRNVINTRLRTQGYTQAEIDATLGSNLNQWRTHTYRDLLNLNASRRLKPRYDAANDLIVLDGPEQPVKSVGEVDEAVV